MLAHKYDTLSENDEITVEILAISVNRLRAENTRPTSSKIVFQHF